MHTGQNKAMLKDSSARFKLRLWIGSLAINVQCIKSVINFGGSADQRSGVLMRVGSPQTKGFGFESVSWC